MKYVCFGYYDKGQIRRHAAAKQNAMFDPCFEYDQSSRQRALGWSEALRGPETALTLSWKNRKVETLTVCNPRALFPRDHTRNAYSLLAGGSERSGSEGGRFATGPKRTRIKGSTLIHELHWLRSRKERI